MAVTDPLDARLLAALAELGKAAVHEVAAKVGMDPRDVAYRLVNLSASGLPLLVGVESDPNGLRAALAGAWGGPQQPPQPPPPPQPPQPQGGPGGPQGAQGVPSGAYPVQGVPSGAYPVHGAPSGAYPVRGAPSGAYPVQGTPSGRYQPPPPPQQQRPPQPPPPPDPVMSTWGPPQSALWARGDQPPSAAQPPATPKTGRAGDVLETQGLEGEQLAVQLLEVQDPADYLFGAAGYRLDEGERAVVVHTEITNRGRVPFASLPDNYLELITSDGAAIAKAPVSLTSRPPHKIGVQPGETTGGHTVYVLPEATRIASVRWSPRPEPDERSLLWSIED
ncbi:AsnC family protein [Prauserella endophytica]|uniref:AsnC family protein n=1 Tax=Prauserella endophytica TaxID=1592324 RepID=A0ABY2S147_9PSEU|nr:AsnC family protein [Prauserella endophytica]TKG66692.1 AsnC family protein [Prauserella endophytica]